ncbi:exported hypothetical protein [Limnobacter sp. 130]|mgnify:CR=1 FL=1|uniref:hypothetical protein n=1 Tax=Limnobacter sp. 130 TaxID=2653147 RepID=UPI0012EEEDA0|nr:hypothetical protein [Limnobacter sp. 130]VWX35558.1 exported hypothetical protein [Limnobacter sp. 130]
MLNPKLALCVLLVCYQGHAMANPVMEIDAAVQPQMKLNESGAITSCGIRVLGLRTIGVSPETLRVDGFDMSTNIYDDEQVFGLSKVIFLQGKIGESLQSGKYPVASPYKSFWLRSDTRTLKSSGKFITGGSAHSLMVGHDFSDAVQFIAEVLESQTLRLGLNFEDSTKNMAYVARIRIPPEDQREISQCLVGMAEKLQEEINQQR